MVGEFVIVPVGNVKRPRIYIAGEILVKYCTNANEHPAELIESESGEAVVPDMANFLSLYVRRYICTRSLEGAAAAARQRRNDGMAAPTSQCLLCLTPSAERASERRTEKTGRTLIARRLEVEPVWEDCLIAAEMVSLIESGVKNVLCVQFLACLPNQITGKDMLEELKRRLKGANFPFDCDARIITMNHFNRVKSLMVTAGA